MCGTTQAWHNYQNTITLRKVKSLEQPSDAAAQSKGIVLRAIKEEEAAKESGCPICLVCQTACSTFSRRY